MNIVTNPVNPCPYAKQYKMLPIERPKDAPVIKRPAPVPTIGAVAVRTHYRVLKVVDETATICEKPNVLDGGQLTVINVDVSRLGVNAVQEGDVLRFDADDVAFERPTLSHRAHQNHQHPEHLVLNSEK